MNVFSYENIYRAYLDCRKNKRNRPDALLFETNAEENLFQLHFELVEKSFHRSTSSCFVSRMPKLREIFAADFRDRITHHLVVRYLESFWEPIFIHDSYASRPGKGIHLAAKRLRSFARRVTCNESQPAFYLQLDIKNFFMTIDKHILFALIRSRCQNKDILWLVQKLLFHDPTQNFRLKSPKNLLKRLPRQKSLFGVENEKGLPIGNLTSQFFANVYMNSLDHFVKHSLKCRFYLRYVDDFILLHADNEQLVRWRRDIVQYLKKELQLELNTSRSKLRSTRNGIDFVGYIVRPNYILSRNRVVNNLKSKLKYFEQKLLCIRDNLKVINYDIDILEELFVCLNSYLAHFKHANTWNLVRRIFQRNLYLNEYFTLTNGKLKRLYLPPRNFARMRDQYRYFVKKYHDSILFFQVGCFYEFYGIQALNAARHLKLKLIKPKHGFHFRCGIGQRALERNVQIMLKKKKPVVVINQTGYLLNRVAERRQKVFYLPIG